MSMKKRGDFTILLKDLPVITELFDVNVPAIPKHLKNVFDEGELIESSVISIFETTTADGKRDIRSSERRFYQKITDIDKKSLIELTSTLFNCLQSQFIWYNKRNDLPSVLSISF